MRVVGRDVISRFIQKHGSAKLALQSWLCEIESGSWASPEEVLTKYRRADFLPNNRIIFHNSDDGFKLLALAVYESGIVVVEKVGTIAEYSKWNLE